MDYKLQKIKKYFELIGNNRWSKSADVENITACPCDYKTGNTPPALNEFVPFENGGVWGHGWDSHSWFHFTLDKVARNEYLSVETDLLGWDADNPQFIVYINGEMRQGMDTNHREVLIGECEKADIYLYAYTGPKVESTKLFVERRTLNEDVDGLYYDILYPIQMLDYLPDLSTEYGQIEGYLHRAVSILSLYDMSSEEFFESVREAREYLATEFYGKYCREQTATDICIGHTHIDCAWKWTLLQTREKVQRSFATVLELMRRYPEYKFMSSQALLYKDLKEEAPEVYGKVIEKIKEGRWECEGAMWVEADCNLSSGESLVRQVMYGKRFFKDEFGVENRVLWLPDVFGYSAALPQILKKSGVDWFVTSKISWNDMNQMPYDTFSWKGIDGTEINSYFLTAANTKNTIPPEKLKKYSSFVTTYNAMPRAQQIAGTYERYQQKELSDEVLVTFGFGDGGGGPTSEHLELLRRAEKGIPGSPQTKIEFAGDFLKKLESKIENNPALPTWQGELYLEYHRGTYTTMADNKKCNRKSEFLYENAELLGVTAKSLFGDKFPKEKLHEGWEMILTNQFHDIIPGSSIKEVYDQSEKDYKVIAEIGNSIVTEAQRKIASSIDAKHGYAVFNPNSFEGEGYVNIDGKTAYVKGIAPKGYTATDKLVTENNVSIIGNTVETDRLKVVFDDAWQMISVFDKQNERELLKKNAVANELRIHADYPGYYDAWEWKSYSLDDYKSVTDVQSVETVDDGARKGIKIVRKYGKSVITQTVWFYDGTTQIDFDTHVDWHERHKMLKAVFPVDIQTDKATYDIQFGSIERPTHKNTSWDEAKYEVCAHKYADISEGNYGIAIMNDCKYGHDIHDSVIQLSLLRSPTDPNPEADQGEHSFTYSLYPHDGALNDSDTVKRAYMLNNPMVAVAACGSKDEIAPEFSAVTFDCDHVICETVKEAEDGEETVIRFYEYKNMRDSVKVKLGIPAKKAYLCDLLEREICELPVENGTVTCPIKGFEIVTVKVM
ncbi:MAG: alpha-mannosidase [Ruminococcaceae bacterium]|nr:alpha-mannosidase [Oscillospiraceae bacterium]